MILEREAKTAGAGKANIFISYSRKDAAFVDRLQAGLVSDGFTAVVDRTEIYAFEAWWPRVEALIINTDTLVFVISPDAVCSEVCRKEVAFAASLKKRLAPIMCRPTEMASVPEELSRLNIIDFADDAQFDQNRRRLAEALSTDIAWIRDHTRFGEMAQRWAISGRPGPKGLLLRPPLLEEAERWIASRPPGAPLPTDNTRALIETSRSAETKRRKTLVGSLTAGLVGACVMAGYAFSQKSLAERQTDAANRSLVASKIALADLQLARDDLVASLGHALEAENVEAGYERNAESRSSSQALQRIVAANRLVLHLHRYASLVPNWPFEFLDETTLAYTTEKQGLFVVDLKERRLLWHVDLPDLDKPEIMQVSRQYEAILIAAESKLAIIDSDQRKLEETLEFPSPIRAVSLSSKDEKVAIALDRSLVLFDLDEPDQRTTVDVTQVGQGQRIRRISFDRTGSLLYVTIADNFNRSTSILEYDVKSERFSVIDATDAETMADDKSELSAFGSTDRTLIYTSRLKNKFGIFDASTGAVSDLRQSLVEMGRLTASPALIPVSMHHRADDNLGQYTSLFAISRSLVRGAEAMMLSVHLVSEGRNLIGGRDIKYRPLAGARTFGCRASGASGYLACYFSSANAKDPSPRSREWLGVWNLASDPPTALETREVLPTARKMLRRLTEFDAVDAPFAGDQAQERPPVVAGTEQ